MKRAIAILLVLSMFLLSGCDVKATISGILGKEESTTVASGESTTNPIVDGNAPTNNNDSQIAEQQTQGQTSGGSGSSQQTKPTEGSKKPETTAQIVEYFNKNGNRVKTEATKVVKNYEDREVSNIQASDFLKNTAGGIMDAAFKDDTEPTVYATREEIVENFQVPKQSYVSVITVNDVAEATCVENGNQYIITIRAKDEKNPVTGKGVGAAFDIIEASEVKEKAPSFVKEFSTDYRNCVVKAVFDKSTGRMITANYTVRLTLYVTAFNENASMDLSFEKDYTITY